MPRGHYPRKQTQVERERAEKAEEQIRAQAALMSELKKDISNLMSENNNLNTIIAEHRLENNRIKDELLEVYRNLVNKT